MVSQGKKFASGIFQRLFGGFQHIKAILVDIINRSSTRAFMLNILVFLLLNAIAYARFESDADIMINALLSNVSGTRGTAHVGFVSLIIMKPIFLLTKSVPKFAWYTWFVIICAFVSITILNWLLLRKRTDRQFIILVTVLDIFVGYECYMFPSYIKSAVIGTFATMMLLLYLVNIDGIKKALFVIPAVGFLFNSLFSFRGFILGLLAGTVISLIHLSIVNRNKKRLLFIGVFILSTIILTLGIHLLDRHIVYGDKSDDNIIGEYIDDVEKLIVFGYPKYHKGYEEDYNLTQEQYGYLVTYNDFFTREHSVESMRFIHGLADSKIVFNGEKLLTFFRTVPIRMIKVGYTFLFIIIAFVFMISNHQYRGRYVWMMIGYLFIVYGIAYFNYAWDNKIVQMVAFLPATYFLLMNMPIASELENKDLILYLVLMSVILYNNFSTKIVTSVGTDDLVDFFDEMVADESKTAVFNLNGFYRGRSPYEPYIEGWIDKDNLILTNGYYSLFAEFDNNQYFSHLGEWIVHNGEADVNLNNYLVCRETDTES